MNKYTYTINDNVIRITNTETKGEIITTAEDIDKLTNQNNFELNIRDYLINTIKTLEKIISQIEDLYLKGVYEENGNQNNQSEANREL